LLSSQIKKQVKKIVLKKEKDISAEQDEIKIVSMKNANHLCQILVLCSN